MIEGPRLLAEALDAGIGVHDVYVDEHAEDRVPAGSPVATLVRAGVLDGVGDATSSQGVLATAEIPQVGLESLGQASVVPSALVLVLVDIADPGNVGTLLRAADAAGACAIAVGGADVFGPKVVRSSAGAVFRVPLAEADEPAVVLDWLRERGVRAWATAVRGGIEAHRADLAGPTALILGNEARGLDQSVVASLSDHLTIPMPGTAESLNVAMAGTVLLYEALRQRR